jgi:Flp pilus assembly protein TadG
MEHKTPRRILRIGLPRRTRGSDHSRGQAMVEFGLVLPIFVLLLVGMMDFGVALYSRMTVINAAREGARAAVTAPDPTVIPVLVNSAANAAANGLTIGTSVSCVAIATSPGPCSFATATSSKPGDAVSVAASYTYQTFFPLFFGATFDLGSTVQMVRE